jgi:hypothetical protein
MKLISDQYYTDYRGFGWSAVDTDTFPKSGDGDFCCCVGFTND